MPNAQFFNPQNELDAKRRMRLAQALRQAAQTPQAPAGTVVAQSPWAALARGVAGGIGQDQERMADETMTRDAADRQKFLQQAIMNSGNDTGKLAEQFISQPEYAVLGVKMKMDDAREQRMAAQQERMYNLAAQRAARSSGGDGPTPAALKIADALRVARGGEKLTVEDIVTAGKLADKSMTYNPDGTVSPRSGYNEAVMGTESAKGFGQKVGEKSGEELIVLREKAKSAASTLRQNDELVKLLDSGMVTGTGANYRVAFGKALNTIGWNSNPDPEINAQAYTAMIGGQVAEAIKAFGAGTGLSDADRAFAEKMVAGDIAIDEGAIRKIITMRNTAANNLIDAYNKEYQQTPMQASPYDLSVAKPVVLSTDKPAASGINDLKSKYGLE